MKGKTPAISLLTAIVPTLIITAAVIVLCIANFRSEAWGRNIARIALSGSGRMPRIYQQIDDIFLRQMPSGNIWVRFEGYDPEVTADEDFMERIYYRGNYAIFPRRLYVSHPATAVNNSEAMVPADEVPYQLLTNQLGINWLATISRNTRGQVYWTIRRLQ